MGKKIIHSIFIFLLGAMAWHFIYYFLPEKPSQTIIQTTEKILRILNIKLNNETTSEVGGVSYYQYESPEYLPIDSCPDYKEIVSITEKWLSNYGARSTDSMGFSEFATESEDGGLGGIVKWRFQEEEPYFGLPAEGEWEHYVENADITKLEQLASTELLSLLTEKKYTPHSPMNIPFYRYPNGEGSKKIGLIKNDIAYLIGIIEVNSDEFRERFSDMKTNYDLKNIKRPVALRISCANVNNEDTAFMRKFLTLPHSFSNESVIYMENGKDKLRIFGVIYPGGSNGYREEWFTRYDGGNITLIQKAGELPLCSPFEKMKTGRDQLCFRPEKQEFDVVKY